MVRVKGGTTTNRKHTKVLDLAKGYWMSRHKQIKKAKEAVLHAGEYAFAGRKHKKRDIRALWIVRLNAALKGYDMKYSTFIHNLKLKKIDLDRKVLAQIALDHPEVFGSFVQKIKSK
jgi:large subunit ribosomal protein L20